MIDEIIGIPARADKNIRGNLQIMGKITDLVDVRLIARKGHHIFTRLIRPVRIDAATTPGARSNVIWGFHGRMLCYETMGGEPAVISGYWLIF